MVRIVSAFPLQIVLAVVDETTIFIRSIRASMAVVARGGPQERRHGRAELEQRSVPYSRVRLAG